MDDSSDAAREAWHALFNNGAFADVVVSADRLLEAATDGTVTTRRVAADLSIGDSVARPVMLRLVKAGLLGELPRSNTANGPRHFHRRNPDRWQLLRALVASVASEAPPAATGPVQTR